MDGLLKELANSGVACLHAWGILLGSENMLTTTKKVLKIFATICGRYANKFDVLFNCKKC